MNQAIDLHAILPELILSGTIMLVLIADAFLSQRRKWFTMPLGFVGVLAALIAVQTLVGEERSTFGGAFVVDDFAVLFKTFFLSVALVVLMLSLRYFRDGRFYQGEYYFLLLTSFLGCVLMPSSRDLLVGARERAGVPHRGVPEDRPPIERGRHQVLPDRGALDRRDAVRDEPHLRGDGDAEPRGDRA
jgi:hypothetical protein